MDICAIFGVENEGILSKMIANVFRHQPKYLDDLQVAAGYVHEVRDCYRLCASPLTICPHLLALCRLPSLTVFLLVLPYVSLCLLSRSLSLSHSLYYTLYYTLASFLLAQFTVVRSFFSRVYFV